MTATEYPIGGDQSHEDEQSYEDEPLLPNDSLQRRNSHAQSSFIHQTHSPRIIILLLSMIIFVLAFGGFLVAVPGIRIYEDIICHHYYENLEGEGHIGLEENIDEKDCKGDEVQNELNFLLAVLHFLGAIPALLMTVPYGLLADRIGRKLVFVLSLTGIILSGAWCMIVMWFWRVLPIRLIWLSPLFIFIGGGEAVASMMFFAVGCDITTESNRANVFLFGKSAGIFAELIAPTIASFLMAKSPWIPLILGMAILAFGTSLIIFIPETLHLRPSEAAELTPDSSSEHSSSSKTNKINFFMTAKTQISDTFRRVYESSTVLHSLPILLLLITFVTEPVGRQGMDLSLRYISKRFSWELRQTGFLLSLRALVNIVLLLGILPAFSYYLTERLHFSSKAKDLSLARYSVTVLVIGALIFAASPTIGLTIIGLIIYTLGGGFVALTRALITTLIDKEHVARLYAAIAVVEVTSALAAGPSLAALWAVGLKFKGPWIGLPYYAITIICFMGGLGVWCFGFLTRKQEEEMPYGDEDRDTVVGNTVFLEGDTAETGLVNVV